MRRKGKAAFRFKKQCFYPAQKGRNRNGLFLALTTAQPQAAQLLGG